MQAAVQSGFLPREENVFALFCAIGRAVRLLAAQEDALTLFCISGRAVRLLAAQEDALTLSYTSGRAARSAIGKDRIKKERSIYNWVN